MIHPVVAATKGVPNAKWNQAKINAIYAKKLGSDAIQISMEPSLALQDRTRR